VLCSLASPEDIWLRPDDPLFFEDRDISKDDQQTLENWRDEKRLANPNYQEMQTVSPVRVYKQCGAKKRKTDGICRRIVVEPHVHCWQHTDSSVDKPDERAQDMAIFRAWENRLRFSNPEALALLKENLDFSENEESLKTMTLDTTRSYSLCLPKWHNDSWSSDSRTVCETFLQN